MGNKVSLPQGITDNPRLSSWIQFVSDNTVLLLSGKVELGQGINTALLQIVAEELCVEPTNVTIQAGDTSNTPNEGWTSASISIEVSGSCLRLICADINYLFKTKAEQVLKSPIIALENGVFNSQSGKQISYWDLKDDVDLNIDYLGINAPKKQSEYKVVGQSLARIDLIEKISGEGFIHDFEIPNMMHARIIRPPHFSGELLDYNEEKIRKVFGVEHLIINGNFMAICGTYEEQIINAVDKVQALVKWSSSEGIRFPNLQKESINEFLTKSKSVKSNIFKLDTNIKEESLNKQSFTFSKPFIAHASIGTVCGIAKFEKEKLVIWSQTQGVFPLQSSLSKTLSVPKDNITVIHLPGAGCYGHNGADDVALEAALISKQVKAPVRLVWSREEEMTCAPLGSGMSTTIDVGIDADGQIKSWETDIYSLTHLTRPGWGSQPNLLASYQISPSFDLPEILDPDIDKFGGGATRNSVPLYDFPKRCVDLNLIQDTSIRTSALRALGAYTNVFAIESIMDELAKMIDKDPIEYRLEHLNDLRSKKVINDVAELSGWYQTNPDIEGFGRGFSFAQYRNKSAYFAVVVEIRVEEEIVVEKVYASVDVGMIVNPDGTLNQLEGGIIQAISWTLIEQVIWDDKENLSNGWESYPILNFDQIPEIEINLIEDKSNPSLGVGECAAGPIAAAINNALSDALDIRMYDLPLTREKIISKF